MADSSIFSSNKQRSLSANVHGCPFGKSKRSRDFRAIRKNFSFSSWEKLPLVYSPIPRPERFFGGFPLRSARSAFWAELIWQPSANPSRNSLRIESSFSWLKLSIKARNSSRVLTIGISMSARLTSAIKPAGLALHRPLKAPQFHMIDPKVVSGSARSKSQRKILLSHLKIEGI